jgi:argininosuccinate lyase
VDTALAALRISARVVQTLGIHMERMQAATEEGFLTATDVADELVRSGVPFGQAHELVGKLVRHCVERGKTFAELSVSEARLFIPSWNEKLRAVATSSRRAVQRRDVVGGTAPQQVKRQVAASALSLMRLKQELHVLR